MAGESSTARGQESVRDRHLLDAMRNSELLAVRDELQAKAVAERTLDVYGGELRRLGEWLDGAPLTGESLALYLCALYGEGKSASTIGTVVAAARFRAKNEELPCRSAHRQRRSRVASAETHAKKRAATGRRHWLVTFQAGFPMLRRLPRRTSGVAGGAHLRVCVWFV